MVTHTVRQGETLARDWSVSNFVKKEIVYNFNYLLKYTFDGSWRNVDTAGV